MTHRTKIKLQYSIAALKAQREKLARENWHEYTTRGNTQKCQELFAKIEKIDAELENRMKGETNNEE